MDYNQSHEAFSAASNAPDDDDTRTPRRRLRRSPTQIFGRVESADFLLRKSFQAVRGHKGAGSIRPFPVGPGYPGTRVTEGQNRQDEFELFWREPGEKCVTMEPETRVPNAALFHFAKEDHTLGNLLRRQLLKNSAVLFSAYKVPHPLFPNFELRVQTDGNITPKEALEQACRELVQDLETLSREFTKEWELQRVRNVGVDGM